MATASRKQPMPAVPRRSPEPQVEPTPAVASASSPSGSLRAFDAVFRFLASLNLAVICLGSLVATLAVGTWINSRYGMNAANELVYQTTGFALLLAFLAANVFCAALIRFPWKKRQTGFVITHVGLLIVIGGSWWAKKTSDEGLLGLLEGETKSELIQTTKPMLYVRSVDPHSGQKTTEYRLPFRPGVTDWSPGRYEVVDTSAGTPFKLAIKRYYAASMPSTVHRAEPSGQGQPMVKIRPMITPPGQDRPMDVLRQEDQRWFVADPQILNREVRKVGPATFVFSYVEDHDVIDDFLDFPEDLGREGVARIHYDDQAGQRRRADFRLDDLKPGQPVSLPASDLVATLAGIIHDPVKAAVAQQVLGDDFQNVVEFDIRRGDGPTLRHSALAMLPTAPPIRPNPDKPGDRPTPLARIAYFYPPVVNPETNGRYGLIEVMGDDHGRLAYRAWGRGTPAVLRSKGPIKVGQTVSPLGGDNATPMRVTMAIEEFFPSGVREEVAESIQLPPDKVEESIPAALAELTVKGVTKEVWLRKSPTFEPEFHTVSFPDGVYEVALDSTRLDLGFALTLKDFDVGFDPGSSQASSYTSDVTLTDEPAGIKDKPVSIFMNHTLDHNGWRFFQTSYQRHRDPRTGRETGAFISVFQVAKNPARWVIYGGCIVVVLGAFVQFYMRAGIFTDGGKRERERAAAKARERLAAKFGTRPAADLAGGAGVEDL